MKFNLKLQELRKKKGLTQEELAEVLYVSRTAISKWESGRGYPSIDSLKEISKFFSVTIDELLSSDQILTIAEEDSKQKETHFRSLVFGLLDISFLTFFFLPLFGYRTDGIVQNASLLSLIGIAPYLKLSYYAVTIGITLYGILVLVFRDCQMTFWVQIRDKLSFASNTVAALLFIISSQPYAATLSFIFLVIKVLMLIKHR